MSFWDSSWESVDPNRIAEYIETFDMGAYKELQYDLLADVVRSGLDMELIYRILNREVS